MFTEHNVSCAHNGLVLKTTFFNDACVFVYFITSSACKLPLFKLAQATEFLPSLSPLCVSVYLVVLLNLCVCVCVCTRSRSVWLHPCVQSVWVLVCVLGCVLDPQLNKR